VLDSRALRANGSARQYLPVCLPRLTGPCRCDLPWDQPLVCAQAWDGWRMVAPRRGSHAAGETRLRRVGLPVASQICQDDVQRFPLAKPSPVTSLGPPPILHVCLVSDPPRLVDDHIYIYSAEKLGSFTPKFRIYKL